MMYDPIEQRLHAAWEKQNYLHFVVAALRFNLKALTRVQEQYATPRALRAASHALNRVEDVTSRNFRFRWDLGRSELRAREGRTSTPELPPTSPAALPVTQGEGFKDGMRSEISEIERLKHYRELRKRIEGSIDKANDDRAQIIKTLGTKAFSELKQTWNEHMGFLVERIDETLAHEKTAELHVVLCQLLQFDRGQGLHTEIAPSLIEQATQLVAQASNGVASNAAVSPFVPIVLGEKDAERKLATLVASGFLFNGSLQPGLAPTVNHYPTFGKDAHGRG